MNADDKRRFDSIFELYERAWEQLNTRRSYEWKVNIAFWTVLSLAIAGSMNIKWLPRIPGDGSTLIGIGGLICLLHLVWAFGIHPANKCDRDVALSHEKILLHLADSEFSKEFREQLDRVKTKWFRKSWFYVFQLGITACLVLILLFLNWNRVRRYSTPDPAGLEIEKMQLDVENARLESDILKSEQARHGIDVARNGATKPQEKEKAQKGEIMDPVELIAKARTGVAQVIAKYRNNSASVGTAFLVEGGIVTNSHNVRQSDLVTFMLKFEDDKSIVGLSAQEFNAAVCAESSENAKDYIYLKMARPEFTNRHVFEFGDTASIRVGEQILFLGYPFGQYERQLTSHLGYVSAIFDANNVTRIKIDGSVNGGNSGGPLLDLKTGKVVGIITRANVGFVVQEFDNLIMALRQNQLALEQTKGMMSASGIDPFQALQASQQAMERIALNLKQSANVGIGYAYSSNYVRDDIAKNKK